MRAIFLLPLALALPTLTASAIDYEAGIGFSHYLKKPDGYWYQDGFPHDMKMTTPAVQVGITDDLWQGDNFGIGYHADIVWLGTVHTKALAVPNDFNYNTTTKGCNGPCLPLATYTGSGHDQGVMLTLEPHYDYKGWRLAFEGGPYLHRPTWSEVVTGVQYTAESAPVTVHSENITKWTLGYVAGTSIGYKNFTLSYQYFSNDGVKGDPASTIWKGTHLFSVKYKF